MRQGEPGEVFTIEGYVTAGTAKEGNKFFDTIYVQNEAISGLRKGRGRRNVFLLPDVPMLPRWQPFFPESVRGMR